VIPDSTEVTAPEDRPEKVVSDERVRRASFGDLTVNELYSILRLRSEVFVVEQACVYLDPDGHDTHPETQHLWIERDGSTVAYLRVIDERSVRRIGRVVTHPDARNDGIAGRLLQHALDRTSGPWVLDAQSHLTAWYTRFGFVVAGDEFVEDGIPHVPMRRADN